MSSRGRLSISCDDGLKEEVDQIVKVGQEYVRDRIRTELIDWLTVSPTHSVPGYINGRRIVDEIDRICPKE